MQNLKQLIKEFRESRNGFSQDELVLRTSGSDDELCTFHVNPFVVDRGSVSADVNVSTYFHPNGEELNNEKESREFSEFIIHSANNITKLLDAMEVLVEGLEKINEPKYGLQGYVEEDDTEGERKYLSRLVLSYEDAARLAIQLAEDKVLGDL